MLEMGEISRKEELWIKLEEASRSSYGPSSKYINDIEEYMRVLEISSTRVREFVEGLEDEAVEEIFEMLKRGQDPGLLRSYMNGWQSCMGYLRENKIIK